MKKSTKKALRELLETVKSNLNNPDNPYINQLMPEVGTFETEDKDVDDAGNWGFRKSYITVREDDALKEAQDELLNGLGQVFFDEFLFETEIRNKLSDFMRMVCKELIKC